MATEAHFDEQQNYAIPKNMASLVTTSCSALFVASVLQCHAVAHVVPQLREFRRVCLRGSRYGAARTPRTRRCWTRWSHTRCWPCQAATSRRTGRPHRTCGCRSRRRRTSRSLQRYDNDNNGDATVLTSPTGTNLIYHPCQYQFFPKRILFRTDAKAQSSVPWLHRTDAQIVSH